MGPLRPGMFSEERSPSSTSRPKAYPTLDYPRVIKTADERTLEFYSREAKNYAQRTASAPSSTLKEFLSRLPQGAAILELGCGSGRDTIEMSQRGYDVLPTDGSPEMARQAELHLDRPVAVLEFGDIEWESKFDGVWASACLLHVRKDRLADIVSRIHRALRTKGILWASLKAGEGEGRDRFGRYYHYVTPLQLKDIFAKGAPWGSTANS
jgi:SAM-dependent methyltransferase